MKRLETKSSTHVHFVEYDQMKETLLVGLGHRGRAPLVYEYRQVPRWVADEFWRQEEGASRQSHTYYVKGTKPFSVGRHYHNAVEHAFPGWRISDGVRLPVNGLARKLVPR